MVSKDFDDLRPYMPKLSFTSDKKMRLLKADLPLDIQGNLVTSVELKNAFENLEKRRSNALATLNKQLDEPFYEKKKKIKS